MGASRVRRLGLAALVLPALALAAVAARSHQPFTGQATGERAASTTFVDAVFTLAAVVLMGLLGVLVWLRLRLPKRPGRNDTGRRSLFGLLLYLIVITAAFTILRHGLQQDRPVPPGEGDADLAFPPTAVPGQPPRPEAAPARGPRFMWPLAGGAAALIAAALIAALIVRRGRDEAGPTPEELEALSAALDEALDDLRREPDPRRAVVAAYARMEQALTVFGLPRRPSETPYEYLTRAGRTLEAEEAMSSLTELMELAKFSAHAIDEPMRLRAIDALTSVREEVRAAA